MKNNKLLIVLTILLNSFCLVFSSNHKSKLRANAQVFVPQVILLGTKALADMRFNEEIAYTDDEVFFKEGLISYTIDGKSKSFNTSDDCFLATQNELTFAEWKGRGKEYVALLIDRGVYDFKLPQFELLPPPALASHEKTSESQF